VKHRYPAPPGTSTLFAVDPGKRYCGIASGEVASEGAVLLDVATLARWEVLPWALARGAAGVWVCEVPQAYKTRRSTHRDLAALRATLDDLPEMARAWTPKEWKGGLPKEQHHARVRKVLQGNEGRVFDAADHNGKDAACLWLFAVGRVGRGGAR